MLTRYNGILLVLLFCITAHATAKEKAKVVFISGTPSHGAMKHEHRAGNMILAESLNRSGLDVEGVLVPHPGYPKDSSILKGADTVVIFCTGHRGHVLNPHLDEFDELMKSGTGVVMIHWATEAEKGKPGDKFLSWMGGFCDLHWSVNPHWTPNFKDFPDHPIANGVKPFRVDDEWYYHMRFREPNDTVTKILTAIPPDSTRERPDGLHSNNPIVRANKGHREVLAWAYERPDGGRGFGCTGGHFHSNWANDDFRTLILNALVWTSGVTVPKNGIESHVSDVELTEDLDPPPPPRKKKRAKQ